MSVYMAVATKCLLWLMSNSQKPYKAGPQLPILYAELVGPSNYGKKTTKL